MTSLMREVTGIACVCTLIRRCPSELVYKSAGRNVIALCEKTDQKVVLSIDAFPPSFYSPDWMVITLVQSIGSSC